MGNARYGADAYTVALADTPRDRAAIQALRAAEYAVAQPYLRATDEYDDRSYVFGCWSAKDRAPVATCRFTTAQGGRFELDDLAPEWTGPPVPRAALLETSRVVVRRDHRATGLVETMLLLAGSWLLAETSYRFNFAVCARPLVRLYARLGMKRIADHEIELRGRPPAKRYVVIYGDMAGSQSGVLARLGSAGWEVVT